jgi:glycosyltransferase involved in cell wall biosynthesis
VTISVITSSYNNTEDLRTCIARVHDQTYTDWQHIIVHDGPNPDLRYELEDMGYKGHGKRVFVELGRNWHGFMGGDAGRNNVGDYGGGARGGRGSRSAVVVRVASHLASGEYIGYCDADCELLPDHLQQGVEALDYTEADFVYTQVERRIDGRTWDIIGDGHPRHGAIDGNAIMHRAELFQRALWEWGGDIDWVIVAKWMEAGAVHAFIPKVTVIWKHASNDI